MDRAREKRRETATENLHLHCMKMHTLCHLQTFLLIHHIVSKFYSFNSSTEKIFSFFLLGQCKHRTQKPLRLNFSLQTIFNLLKTITTKRKKLQLPGKARTNILLRFLFFALNTLKYHKKNH